MYGVGVRNVHHERHESVAELSLQAIGVSLLAYGTEHAKSLRNKHLCGSPTNTGGDSGDNDIFAVRHRISLKMITVHLRTWAPYTFAATCVKVYSIRHAIS